MLQNTWKHWNKWENWHKISFILKKLWFFLRQGKLRISVVDLSSIFCLNHFLAVVKIKGNKCKSYLSFAASQNFTTKRNIWFICPSSLQAEYIWRRSKTPSFPIFFHLLQCAYQTNFFYTKPQIIVIINILMIKNRKFSQNCPVYLRFQKRCYVIFW